MEEIYSNKKVTEIMTEEQQLDQFFKEIIMLAKGDSKTIASMLINPSNWAAKVNEDGKKLHASLNLNLLRYLTEKDSTSLGDDSEELLSKEEKMQMLLKDIRVTILLHHNECQIAMLTMNNNLSDFQILTIEKIIEKCKKYGKQYNCNIYIGFMNQLASLDVEGFIIKDGILDEEVETRLLELVSSTKKETPIKHTM